MLPQYSCVCPWLEYGQPIKGYTIRENWPFTSQQLMIANFHSAKSGPLCPAPLSMMGFALVQIMCVLDHCEFISPAAWIVAKRHCFLIDIYSFRFLHSVQLWNYPWAFREEGAVYMFHLGLNIIKILYSWHFSQLWVSLRQIADFQMRVGKCIDQWV